VRQILPMGRATELVLLVALVATSGACVPSSPRPDWEGIPEPSAWSDYGAIFESGDVGAWDHYLWGGFASSIVKRGGTYFLYYQGASSYRYAFDETVCGRAVGVAASSDGVAFEKHDENPIIEWNPTGECEEGAASAGALVDENGEVLILYGANTARDPMNVHADVRLARSADGLRFVDEMPVIEYDDAERWGAGDELFAVAAAYDDEQWRVFYVPNGSPQRGLLGVAWGRDLADLERSEAVIDPSGEPIRAWGSASVVRLDDGTDALFVLDNSKDTLNAWSVSPDEPNRAKKLLGSYRIDDVIHAVVHLDREVGTWFMYYHVGDEYRVRLAPHGKPDATGPEPPNSIVAERRSADSIELTWSPASDPDTGVASYVIYRNGARVRMESGTSFVDAVYRHGSHTYEVSGVNFHGVEGERSTAVEVEGAEPAEPGGR